MIGSGAYNYLNVLGKAAGACWTRNDMLANNIANVNTPNYKRKDVRFESYLSSQLNGKGTLDEAVSNINFNSLEPTTFVDQATLSYRMDGNNVNIDTEEAEYAKNQIRYYTLVDSMKQEFSRIRSVLSKNS